MSTLCLRLLFLQSIWGTLMGRKQHVVVDIFNYDGVFEFPLLVKIMFSRVSVFLLVVCP